MKSFIIKSFTVLSLILYMSCGQSTDVVESGTYTGKIIEVEADKSEIYVKTEDGKTLDLYFVDETKLTQDGQDVPFSTLKEGYNSTFKQLDRGAFEWYGPTGLAKLVWKGATQVSRIQSGYLYHYLGFMLFGVVFLLFFLALDGAEAFLMVGLISWLFWTVGNDG